MMIRFLLALFAAMTVGGPALAQTGWPA